VDAVEKKSKIEHFAKSDENRFLAASAAASIQGVQPAPHARIVVPAFGRNLNLFAGEIYKPIEASPRPSVI
jgi:hypothetical protein